jgi:two-component system, NtrC family, sensor kinase
MKNSSATNFIILYFIFSSIVLTAIGVFSYLITKDTIYNEIQGRLMAQADDWRKLAVTYDEEISAQEKRVRRSAESIVTAQAIMTYELIDNYLQVNKGSLPAPIKEELFKRLARNTVGKTGYIWILDHKGNYVLSKDRLRDGENIWDTKDSDGNLVIHELISKGLAVKGSEIAYHSYPWLNIGETEPREKIAAMINFPQLDWVVGISTYYDDLVDMTYRSRTIEHVKNMIAEQKIGKSGYTWVVDSKGVYQVSKNRLRDEEDISQTKDSNGNYFIQEAIRRAKAAGIGTDSISYPWVNKGEQASRMKVAGLAYVSSWDWVIGSSAYYDDFNKEGSLGRIKLLTIITTTVFIFVNLFVVIFIIRRLTYMPTDKPKDKNN